MQRIEPIMRGLGLLALLSATACELGKQELGELDEGDGDTDGYADCAPIEPLQLDFSLSGFAPGDVDATLTCTASSNGNGMYTFTQCTDAQQQAHADVILEVAGDVLEPQTLFEEPGVTLRYVRRAEFDTQQWVKVETEGQFPLLLAVVDADTLIPADTDFDYGPIELALELGNCDPSEIIGGCSGPTERQLLRADYSGDARSILDGSKIADLGAADGGDSVQFEVTNVQTQIVSDETCSDLPPNPVVHFAIIAYPNS